MRDARFHPIEVLPLVAGLINAGLAHAEKQYTMLADPTATSFKHARLIVERLVRFSEDIAGFHASFEQQMAQWPLGPEVERELAGLRAAVNSLRALATESQGLVEARDRRRWS